MQKVTVPSVRLATKKLVMLTAYDFWSAQLVEKAGADIILVGDSLGMVIQGHSNTLSVTVDEMIYHCKAAARGRENALLVGDMPYLSYHISREETVRNAGRMVSEGLVDAVKLEGGAKRIPMIEALLDAEIPVMGHIGLTPQSVHTFGGFKVQGKEVSEREHLKHDALALQDAGVFSIVLECVPFDLAREISEILDIPTIGIGAGPFCDGQVLVFHDLLGMSFQRKPKFVRPYADFTDLGQQAISSFCAAVRDGSFPSIEESYGIGKAAKIALYGASES